MGSKNSSQIYSSFLNNLKNAKQILSWQSRFNKSLQTYLLAGSNIPSLSTKEESVNILKTRGKWGKMKEWNFWEKNMAIFHDVKKTDIFFLYNLFVCYILLTRKIFSRINRDGIENIFHNIRRIFQMAKIKQQS